MHPLTFHHRWIFGVFILCCAILLSNLVHWIAFSLIRRHRKISVAQRVRVPLNINEHLNGPARWVFIVVCILFVLPWIPIPHEILQNLHLALHIVLVIFIGWFAIGCVYVAQDALVRRFDVTAENNIRARRVHTQTQFLRRIVISFIVIIDFGCILWTFPDPQLWHYTDYSVPVAAIREHFAKVLDASPLWDRQVCATQVTNLSETTMEIRCLLSARNASEQFDLRCIVREAMITFIQENYPDAFPRTRFAAIGPSPAGSMTQAPAPLA